MTECRMEKNSRYCNCTYEPCSRKHKCCECLHYHRQNAELPACFFTEEQERTYNRSISYFIELRQ
jgi:hypothetical protein